MNFINVNEEFSDEEISLSKKTGNIFFAVAIVSLYLFFSSSSPWSHFIFFIAFIISAYVGSVHYGLFKYPELFIMIPDEESHNNSSAVFPEGKRLKNINVEDLDTSDNVGKILSRKVTKENVVVDEEV